MPHKHKKKNCWEFNKCGREPGGMHVKPLGTCPAYTEQKLDGANNGKNSGRACWVVAGTFCKGEIQGTFGAKYDTCEKCEFYQLVRKEEGHKFKMSPMLLQILKGK